MISLVLYIRRETISAARSEGVDGAMAARIADRLCSEVRSEYGGDRHYVPAPDVRGRNQRIVDAKNNGLSQADIARTEGVHPRTVRRVVSQEAQTDESFGSKDWAL